MIIVQFEYSQLNNRLSFRCTLLVNKNRLIIWCDKLSSFFLISKQFSYEKAFFVSFNALTLRLSIHKLSNKNSTLSFECSISIGIPILKITLINKFFGDKHTLSLSNRRLASVSGYSAQVKCAIRVQKKGVRIIAILLLNSGGYYCGDLTALIHLFFYVKQTFTRRFLILDISVQIQIVCFRIIPFQPYILSRVRILGYLFSNINGCTY